MNDLYEYSDFATNGSEIWFIAGEMCLLMQITYKNSECRCLGIIPSDRPYSYRTLFYIKNKIYLIPYMSSTLCIYDLGKCCFIKKDIPYYITKQTGINMRLFGCFFDGNAYLTMYGISRFILRYDIIDDIFELVEIEGIDYKSWFWRCGFEINGRLYFSLAHYTGIVEYDYIHNRVLCDDHKFYAYTYAVKYGNEIIKVLIDDKWNIRIVKINIFTNHTQLITKWSVAKEFKIHEDEVPYVYAELYNDNLILYPYNQEQLAKVYLKTGKAEFIKVIERISDRRGCFCAIRLGNRGIFIEYGTNKLIQINLDDLSVLRNKLVVNKLDNKIINKILKIQKIIYEDNEKYPFESYMEVIKEYA